MRTLRFIVDRQIIKPDPNCDFSNLIPGSEGYLQAEFSFSPEWKGTVRVIGFYSMLGKEYPPQILEDGKTCVIPAEALANRKFKLRAVGSKAGLKITTNKVVVNQDGGKV